MQRPRAIPRPRWRPLTAVPAGCYLLATAGCGQGWDYPTNSPVLKPGDPNRVQVKAARLRSTPGGCEVDVTFRNVSDKSLLAGFTYDILDAAGRLVISRSTAVQLVAPSETATVSSEGTTAGPSGVPCPSGGRARLVDTLIL